MGAHHAPPEWAKAAFQVLRPGGRIAIAELGADYPRDHDNGMRDPGHWGHLLQDSGFVELALTTQRMRLHARAAKFPDHQADEFASHFHDRPIHVVAGRTPLDA